MRRPTIADVEKALEGRHFGDRTRRGVAALAKYPELSYRQVSIMTGVDVARLHAAAGAVPGLRELRSGRQRGARR